MAFLVGSTAPGLQRLAVPFASLLILVLGYGSQWLFATSPELEPGPLTPTQTRVFNALLACLWWTYWRACTVDPGRYEFPRSSRKTEAEAAEKKSKRDEGTSLHSSEDEDGDEDEDNGEGGEGGVGLAGRHHGGDSSSKRSKRENNPADDRARAAARRRWCRKCAAPKPPRAHHCKSCGRCVPRMDHHCPWTGNCVSLQTFPHFLRFLLYTNASLWALGYLLWQRLAALWASRHLPAYLGPTLAQLLGLAALALTAGLTALALGILLATTVRGWLFNVTMIEGWEVERHEAVMQRRGRYDGREEEEEEWWRSGDGDVASAPRAMVDPVEFPYDVGVYANMAQAMGTGNPLLWPLPFAGGPRVARLPPTMTLEDLVAKLGDGARPGSSTTATGLALGVGWAYEENGLNDREGMWPPVDPDKVRNARLWRQRRREEAQYRREQRLGLRNPELPDMGLTPEEAKEAFRRRQEHDLRRWRGTRAQILDELEEVPNTHQYEYRYGEGEGEGERDYDFVDEAYSRRSIHPTAPPPPEAYRPRQNIVLREGRSGWVNSDGEHLGDYGVDEDAEFDDGDEDDYRYGYDGGYDGPPIDANSHTPTHTIDVDDEEVPLAELIRRRKVRTKDGEDT
ncbi:zf-DHHC-domain-containing protein [Nemania sp. NC0429]|nr:zf-DHHC-domain-containing protein [Nemania sp. NC0429]